MSVDPKDFDPLNAPLTPSEFERLYINKFLAPTKTCEFCRYWLGYGHAPKTRKCTSLKSPAYRMNVEAHQTCERFDWHKRHAPVKGGA